jgi:hypothetical protein
LKSLEPVGSASTKGVPPVGPPGARAIVPVSVDPCTRLTSCSTGVAETLTPGSIARARLPAWTTRVYEPSASPARR